MLCLNRITKRYGQTLALDDVSLEFPRGETTALIGPSGCGKSTLLRILIGLVTPDAGGVQFAGEAVTPATLLRVRRQVGYVVQDGGLFPHLTARQNVTLVARYLRWAAARIDARVLELAGLTHLPADCLDRYPTELSGGQNQRVSLMRALMLDPEVLLLDEPLGALDPMIRYDLQSELRDIFAGVAKTVVMVTHDLGEADYLGQQIVLMRAGRIVQRGLLRDLQRKPADDFVARFIRAQRSHQAAGSAAP